jgi:hypothetical protein
MSSMVFQRISELSSYLDPANPALRSTCNTLQNKPMIL